MKQLTPIKVLCNETGTKPSDWEEMEGPESGCGVDYWFVNKKTGEEAYVNDDQGHITVNLGEDCGEELCDDDRVSLPYQEDDSDPMKLGGI